MLALVTERTPLPEPPETRLAVRLTVAPVMVLPYWSTGETVTEKGTPVMTLSGSKTQYRAKAAGLTRKGRLPLLPSEATEAVKVRPPAAVA